jgi:hypothetical protein
MMFKELCELLDNITIWNNMKCTDVVHDEQIDRSTIQLMRDAAYMRMILQHLENKEYSGKVQVFAYKFIQMRYMYLICNL